MKSLTKAAAASAAKWALGLSFGYTFGPIALAFLSGVELSGNFLAKKVVTGFALFPVLFIGLWIWKSFQKKYLVADGSDQAEQSVKSSARPEKAESSPQKFNMPPIHASATPSPLPDSVPPNSTDKTTANKNSLPVLAAVILMVCGVGYLVLQSKTTRSEEAVMTNVTKPWTALSSEQLHGIYAEPVIRSEARRTPKSSGKAAIDLDQLYGMSKDESARKRKKVRLEDIQNLKSYQRTANEGNALSQLELASIYLRGNAVPEDQQLSVHWFWMAAIQGSIEGQTRIASLYANGLDVKEDLAKALAWYLLAAEQGDMEAQYELVALYRKGNGVAQNYQEAAKWALRAAEQSHTSAQWVVGFYYKEGQGVKQDLVQAHKWLNLAVAGGEQRAVVERDTLEKTMSSNQIAEAQRLAMAWRAVK